MIAFATVDDMTLLWRAMSKEEQARAGELLKVVSASLRVAAQQTGRDLDEMIKNNPNLAAVAKSVAVDVVARTLMTSTDQEPMGKHTIRCQFIAKNTHKTTICLIKRVKKINNYLFTKKSIKL